MHLKGDSMGLKTNYANSHSAINQNSHTLNKRLFNTYNRICSTKLNRELLGTNIDLGSGDKGFSKFLNSINIDSFPYDYPDFDIEKDKLEHNDQSIDFVTMNAVIEHINNPDNIFHEISRVLKDNGLIIVRTPNWQLDYKNFYNDPTHVKPYSPLTLRNTFNLYNFETIFIEPGLIEKSWFWWTLPNKTKWYVASKILGGTKSIIGVALKK